MTGTPDVRLYAIVDLHSEGGGPSLSMIDSALSAGVTALQIRGKNCAPRQLWRATVELARVCRRHGTPLFVNDRPDIAAAAGAQGVHLGQNDLPAALIRRLWPALRIGVSVHGITEIDAALRTGVDYVAAGSLYPTGTKADATPLNHDEFRCLAERAACPLIGIGGITPERAAAVRQLGASGVAVISGLWEAVDPLLAVAEYRRAFD